MQDGGAGISGDIPEDMHAFEICWWFSLVNLVTAGFGAMVSPALLLMLFCDHGAIMKIMGLTACQVQKAESFLSRYLLQDMPISSAQQPISWAFSSIRFFWASLWPRVSSRSSVNESESGLEWTLVHHFMDYSL